MDYGLGYYIGTILVNNETRNDNYDRIYNVADITTIFFAILMGAFASGTTAPALKNVIKGREAAYNIYKVIEREIPIKIDDETKKEAKNLRGEIEFRNVKFSYPTRPGSVILNNFNLIIKPN